MDLPPDRHHGRGSHGPERNGRRSSWCPPNAPHHVPYPIPGSHRGEDSAASGHRSASGQFNDKRGRRRRPSDRERGSTGRQGEHEFLSPTGASRSSRGHPGERFRATVSARPARPPCRLVLERSGPIRPRAGILEPTPGHEAPDQVGFTPSPCSSHPPARRTATTPTARRRPGKRWCHTPPPRCDRNARYGDAPLPPCDAPMPISNRRHWFGAFDTADRKPSPGHGGSRRRRTSAGRQRRAPPSTGHSGSSIFVRSGESPEFTYVTSRRQGRRRAPGSRQVPRRRPGQRPGRGARATHHDDPRRTGQRPDPAVAHHPRRREAQVIPPIPRPRVVPFPGPAGPLPRPPAPLDACPAPRIRRPWTAPGTGSALGSARRPGRASHRPRRRHFRRQPSPRRGGDGRQRSSPLSPIHDSTRGSQPAVIAAKARRARQPGGARNVIIRWPDSGRPRTA
ncbi:hypothetical protein G443_002103 [Actinoalloteichus cyanogriseus DSM 43889]|uniref:Basic proline-rich protein n=1 Tax=Actinoalloteichus caeruleus DSM 43889 TaxID=1120930 RepID=A0ABT1JHD0_ACTCY|nr:hypothetical protein [Actinoalloteichus caeruleus DSM 43889]